WCVYHNRRHLRLLPAGEPGVIGGPQWVCFLGMIKMFAAPVRASLLCMTESYFCRQELLTPGWVSAPAFYILSAG
uniref:Uncharacterized protein n=1 Tax=Neovison vison TaxID=452646 RepID=A0A8C7EII9_NEOVI